jgi:tetratricopeptide (TPR) repeat protein
METPAPGPRGPTSAMVPLPLGEVLRIASEYERAGRFDDAKHLLDHVLAVDPNEPNALHLAGMVAFRCGDPEGALELMQRSLTHGIDTPLYLRNICEIYRVLGRLDEALEAGRRATALAPADPQCLQNQAIIHCHRLELDARSTVQTRPCGSTQACRARISPAPRRCCCAATGRRASRSTNGASVSAGHRR